MRAYREVLMKKRTAVPISIVVALLVLEAGAACAEVRPARTWNGDYLEASLSRSGLSLSDDTPLKNLEALPSAASSAGSSRSGGSDRKNPMIAMLLSSAIPGLGEIYAGQTGRGRWFMASEAAIWAGYGAFQLQHGMRTDDYEEFAQIFADAPSGANDGYLGDMGDYIRSEGDNSYNEAVRREARSLFPNDLDAQHAYLEENGYFGDLAWDWGSRERFLEYRELRRAASRSERNAFYMTGLALLNRVFSAIDGAWMARRHNAGLTGRPGARLSVAPEFDGADVGARATLEVSF
jgi:hypothetical protein